MLILTDPKHVDEMTSYMQQQNFSATYISNHVQVFRFIVKRLPLSNWQTYEDVKNWISCQNYNCDYKQRFLRIVSDIDYFLQFHRLPNDKNYSDYLPSFLPLPDELENFLRQQNFCETYIIRHVRMVKFIFRDTVKYSWTSIADVKEWYSSRGLTASSLKDTLKVLSNIEYIHSHGILRGNCKTQREFREKVSSLGSLDLSFWNDHLKDLLSFMRENDYSDGHIQIITTICRKITVMSRSIRWESYKGILIWAQSQGYTKSYMQNIRCALGILEAFHLRGETPNNRNTQNRLCIRSNSFSRLNRTFRDIVVFETNLCHARGLKESSVNAVKSAFSTFLFSMQCAGADTFEEITVDMVSDHFHNLLRDGANRSIPQKIRPIFSDLSPYYPECTKLLLYIPMIHSGRKNIQYITPEEAAAFETIILDPSSNITRKSRAIGTIVYYTGIRSIDIANLQLDSIDLQSNTIHFFQRKTGRSVTIPLLPVVGNAIIDYCTEERPITNSNFLFVGNHAPHHPIGGGAIYIAIESIMREAEIRRNKGDRRGAHIFRHHFATTLLKNNVAPPIITSALGHDSPDSLNSYLYADMDHIKECALSISAYPIDKEVFKHV